MFNSFFLFTILLAFKHASITCFRMFFEHFVTYTVFRREILLFSLGFAIWSVIGGTIHRRTTNERRKGNHVWRARKFEERTLARWQHELCSSGIVFVWPVAAIHKWRHIQYGFTASVCHCCTNVLQYSFIVYHNQIKGAGTNAHC